MTSLVEWAIEVRLDMLTALFGFVSLLFLLDRRVALAALAGLSFLISQKGAMFALAGGFGLLGCLVVQRDRTWLRDAFVFRRCVVLPIGLYVGCWSLIASFPQVYGPTFGQATQLHALTTPIHGEISFYRLFWLETLYRNPLFYLFSCGHSASCSPVDGAGPAGNAAALLRRRGDVHRPECPPTLAVHVRRSCSHGLRIANLAVLPGVGKARQPAVAALCCGPVTWCSGSFWPLSRCPKCVRDDPGPQRQTFELARALLSAGRSLFRRLSVFARLDAHERTLGMVDTNTAHPIHALTPAEHAAILERFQKEPVRFLVYTPVIDDGVPKPILDHLFRNYAPLWGNIWIYAPQCQPGRRRVNLLFEGDYTIETEKPARVLIDGKSHGSGETVELDRGRHAIVAPVRCRLRLQPAHIDHLLDPAYRDPVGFFWPDRGPADPHIRTGVWAAD